MKPIELIERALLNSSKAGDLVGDFFGGSGFTLIACERRGGAARLMELDPRYADVICRRYQEYVGKPATLDGDGHTFEQIAEERHQAGRMSRPGQDCLPSKSGSGWRIQIGGFYAWRSRIGARHGG